MKKRLITLSAVLGMGLVSACAGQSTAPTTTAGSAPASGKASASPSDAAPPKSPYWSDPAAVGQPYPPGKVQGLITFRGNPTRTYYGAGPVTQTTPTEKWTYPKNGQMCGTSIDEHGAMQWCGSGWTGQPSVFEREGKTWVVFGAYDYGVHFLNAANGNEILPTFKTGDIIKGSVTVDPDGFPLVYTGSRDNNLRVLSIDGNQAQELWRLNANDVSPVQWNDDWDGSPLVIDDYLFEGGENSQFHIVKLNRKYDKQGKVTVNPKLVFNAPGWDSQLMSDFGSPQTSIENSVAIYKDTVYFANSAGLVQGWDISKLKQGKDPPRVFRFWTGDDTDATVTIDEEGFLYVGSEYEKGNSRSREVGQMMKLDPRKKGDPLVWSVKDQGRLGGGVWGTPALYKDIVIYDTDGGRVLGIDRQDGDVRWERELPGPLWQSPVVVDDTLLLGDCEGSMHAFDVSDTKSAPKPLWDKKLSGCIESTPAVYGGGMYFGTRSGQFHALDIS